MPWEIAGQVGPHSRSGYDASGWLWEIRRGEGDWPAADVRRVLIEIPRTAGLTGRGQLPGDTAEAIDTEGESEVRKVLGLEDPPRIIVCGTYGCHPEELQTPE